MSPSSPPTGAVVPDMSRRPAPFLRQHVATHMDPARPKRRLVTRREAAKIIGVSVSYVRKLTARKQLVFAADRNGTFVADWAQIEAFARERRTHMTPSMLIAAKVCEMCKAQRPFDEIVVATEQILRLCEHYAARIAERKQEAAVAEGKRRQREQEQQSEMDAELGRRVEAISGETRRKRRKNNGR